jgi:hypothetical protein
MSNNLAIASSDDDPIIKQIEATSATATNGGFPPLSALALSQNFAETAGTKKLLLTVPVRKPAPQDFVRVHCDPQYRATIAVIELKDDRESYLLMPEIAQQLPGECVSVVCHTAINRQGVVHLWLTRLPAPDGRPNAWHQTALEAAERAMTRWVRVRANMSLGAYEVFEAASTIPDPTWPEQSFHQLLEIAFRDRLIKSFDHPVIKRLRGLT